MLSVHFQSIYSTFADEVVTLEEGEETKPVSSEDVETTVTLVEEAGLVAPEFVITLEDVNVKEGKPVKFVAKATGEPTPTITWYHDNEPIIDGEIYKIRYAGICRITCFFICFDILIIIKLPYF